jgi:hypothetical protein
LGSQPGQVPPCISSGQVTSKVVVVGKNPEPDANSGPQALRVESMACCGPQTPGSQPALLSQGKTPLSFHPASCGSGRQAAILRRGKVEASPEHFRYRTYQERHSIAHLIVIRRLPGVTGLRARRPHVLGSNPEVAFLSPVTVGCIVKVSETSAWLLNRRTCERHEFSTPLSVSSSFFLCTMDL